MKNIKEIKIKDQELLNNPLFNTSVVNLVLHKKTELKIETIFLPDKTTVIDIVKTTHTTMNDI